MRKTLPAFLSRFFVFGAIGKFWTWDRQRNRASGKAGATRLSTTALLLSALLIAGVAVFAAGKGAGRARGDASSAGSIGGASAAPAGASLTKNSATPGRKSARLEAETKAAEATANGANKESNSAEVSRREGSAGLLSAQGKAEDDESGDLVRQRADWFQKQRAFAFQHIPGGALQHSIEQRDLRKQRQRTGKGLQYDEAGISSFGGDGIWDLTGSQPTYLLADENSGSPASPSPGERANSQPGNEPAAASPQPQDPQDSSASQTQPTEPQESPDIVRERARWFHDQRAYPFKHIPAGAFQRALQERDAMKLRQGSMLSPQAMGIITFPGDALWHLMGPQPTNQPFGRNSGSPTSSGRITAIAVDTTDASGQTVYIGGAAGGVWKTMDGGAHWTPLTDSQPSLAVGSIAIDPNNHLNIYVGTGEQNFNIDAFFGAGVLKSTDGGTTWTQLGAMPFVGPFNSQVGAARIGAIAVDPNNSSVILAGVAFGDQGSPSGIYRSADGGNSWGPVAVAFGDAGTAVVFDPTAGAKTAYAALGFPFGDTNNGIYKSTDEGATWTKLTTGLPASTGMGRITLGYAPSTTGATATIYAAIADPTTGSSDLLGLFKSTDGGATWSKLTNAPAFCNHQCFYDMAVGVSTASSSFVVVGGAAFTNNSSSLFKSADGGMTWTTSTVGNDFTLGSTSVRPHVDTHAIVFAPTGGTPRLYIGNDGGMWRTDDPTPTPPLWVDLNATLAITQFYPGPSAAISDENYGFGGTQDNDTEVFSGTLDWTNVLACGDGGFTAIDTNFPTTIYTSCDSLAATKIRRSVFNGEVQPGPSSTFFPAETAISASGDGMEFIPPLTIDQNNPNTLYFGTCRVWETLDGAATWNPITGDLSGTNAPGSTCPGTEAGHITTMDVAHRNSGVVLAGTSNGKVWESLNGILTEIDKAPLPPRHVTAVRVDRNDTSGNTAYVAFSGFGSCAGCGTTPGHIFVTTNATAVSPTWTDISGNLPDIPVNDIIVSHNNNPPFDALYIATDVGVFSCPSPLLTLCADWTVIGDGLPNAPVLGLSMRDPSRILRAATHGRSMWQIQLTDENPGPVAFLSSLTPAAAHVGDPTTQVTVTGGNFSTNTQVLFDGVSVGTPTFVSTTQLTISVSSSLLTDGHVFQVSLSDPQGAENGSGPFTVMNPILNATNMTPNTTTTYTPVTLQFSGSNFVNSTVVTFNNVLLTGGAVTGGGTGFSVPVPVSLLTVAMPVTVTITNPLPGGGPTPATSFAFTINPNPNPLAIFSPNPIVLGPVALGGNTSLTTLQLSNPGGATLNVTAASIMGTNKNDFVFVAPTLGPGQVSCNFETSGAVMLTSGSSCFFGMSFTADVPTGNVNPRTATLNVTDNAAGSPQAVSVLGVLNVPTVAITPVNFGPVGIGTTSPTRNATLANFSGATLSVDTIGFTISGANKADFQFVPAAPSGNPACPGLASFSIPANTLCDVGLVFTPSIPGNESATINLSDNGPGSPQSASLSGTGIELTSILPPIVATGGPAFTLTVNGGGFAPSAVVNVNGSARLTAFISANELLASIPASDIAAAGTRAITVTTPNPGGTTSEPKTLFVAQAPPANNDNIDLALFHRAGATTMRTASGPFTGGGNAITLTWSSPLANTNYTAICTAEVIPGIFSLPTITARTSTTITVVPAPGGTPSGIIGCIAIPDSDASTIRKARVPFSGTPATVTVTWSPAFSGSAYVTACTVESSTAATFTSVISTFTPASIVVDNNGYASGTMHCIGIPKDGTNLTNVRSIKVPISGSPLGVAVTWGAPFNHFTNDNTDYVAVCSEVEPGVTSTNAALAISAGSKTVNGFTVINEIPSGTLHCIGVPLGGSANSRFTEDTTQATAQLTAITSPASLATPVDPTPACAPGAAALQGRAKSVWQLYVAPENGTAVADTRFSSYPTILSAWTLSAALPSSTETFTPIACASGDVPAAGSSPVQSSVRFNVTQGTNYYLMVSDATSAGAGGTLTFSIDTGDVAPPNDDNATPITVTPAQLPYSDTINSVLATANTNTHNDPPLPGGCAPGAASGGQANSVWYSFTPTSGGTITADTLTTPYATILNVTSGSANGTQVACNQSAATGIAQSQVSFAAISGTQYFFMISSVLGDGGTTNFHLNFNAAASNPVPTITSFSPTSATASGTAFTLTINGTNFVSGASGTFNGAARTVTFVSATQVTMAVTAADIATAGSFPVIVSNPAPGGGPSAPMSFPVNNPVPTTTSISPTSATAGAAGFTLTVNGTNFNASSVVNFNGAAKATTFVSSTQVTAAIAAADIATAGTVNVTVTNPAPGGGTSSAQSFNINNPAATITSFSPASATAGGAAFTLTINGSNFVSGATGTFNGTARTVTFVSATQVTMAVTAPDIATAGSFPVVVSNPAPGGGSNGAVLFPVNNVVPTLTSISPTSATVGGAAFTLTLNGTGFVSGSTVKFGTAAPTATFVSSTQLTAAITAPDIATAGVVTVSVTNPAPGGGTSGTQNFSINNPVPTITSFSPTSATAGGAAFTLTINGTNFVSGATGTFNGTARTVTFVSATQVTMAVTAPDIATAGSFAVVVSNPAPGGGASAPSNFTVNNPAPTISSLSPTSATAGGAAFTLTVNGTGFVSASSVKFNGTARTTTFVSATQVTAAITAADIATAGTFGVTVTNPAPGGGTSTATNFTVNNPVPTITSFSPTSATAGGAAFTLTINGTNFVSGATGTFNGTARTVTFVSATQVTMAVTAPDIAAAGSFAVVVSNPAPGGGASAPSNFTVNNPAPTITTLSPNGATAGGPAFTLTVNGTGFVSASSVKFNGNAKTTTFISSTQVTAAITAADIATAGSVPVTVTNPAPGGGTSTAVNFNISAANNPVPTLTSISPTSATAGSASFTLTATGTNFVSTSVVNFNGAAKTTTFVSATQVNAAISAADIANGGVVNVTVTNPAPGGGTTAAQSFTINNPAPTITTLSPTSAIAGGAALTLTVNGTGFVPSSSVKFNGNARTTTFVSATQMTAAITAADIATAGTFGVTVTNPAPAGGTSAAANFTVNNPAPTITSLSPTSATASSAAFTLTVNGTNFVAASVVNFNGAAKTTTFVSATQITAAITAADIATAGTFGVTVTNPAPGGGTSTATNFTVNNPAPAITSLSPTGATAGGAAFTLTVNGTGFVSSSAVKFNGTAKTTTFVNATQLTAAITAADIATAGNANVTVTNPAPGGGTSTVVVFNIASAPNPVPTLASISPTSVTAGGPAFTLTVNGTNYVSSSVVNFNGSARTTTVVSATQLTASITAVDIATAGSFPITVFNPAPGGGTSSAVNLAVNNPVPAITTLSPASATVGGAAFTLTVNGTNFVNGASVSFNGVAKTTTFVSATQVTAAISAADIAAVGNFPVIVTNPAPGGGASAAVSFAVNNPAPTITTLAPNSATAGGASFLLTITGTGFVAGATVNFGANPALTPSTITSTTITVTIPAADTATAGNVNVTVTNPAPGGGTSAPPTQFTINNPVPTLASIAPTSGVLSQPVNLVLTGTNFVTGSVVNFGANADNGGVVSNNGTTLTITIPAAQLNAAGPVNVTVTNPAPGGGTTAAQTFTVNNPVPTLTSIAPTSGLLNQSVNLVLTGTNFVTGSVVNFGANADSGGVVSNGGNTLTIAIPAAQVNAAGPVNVTVTNPAPGGGTTAAQTFTVNNPVPTLTSIAPTNGVVGQSVNLVLTGTNFLASSIVNFGANADAGGAVSNGGNTLTITIPAAQLNAAGPVSVSVKNPAPGGGTSAAVQFTVQNVQPVIGSLSPASTTAGGATFLLTINGNSFVTGAKVDFGADKGLAPTSVTASQIQVNIPAADIATGGNVSVVVNNPAPAVAPSLVSNFTVNNPVPTIATATVGGLNHAAGGFAFTLTVNGTNFVSTSQVKFNGKAETTTFVSATQLTAAIPAADVSAGGTVPVTVTNPAPAGGTTAASNFTVDDFTLSGPANPVAVPAGQPASFTITVTPGANGFAGLITFSAAAAPPATALPQGTMVSFMPPSVTPNGNMATTTMTITTTKRGAAPPLPSDRRLPQWPQPLTLFGLASVLLTLAGLYALRLSVRQRRWRILVPALVVLLAAIALGGCSGMSHGTPAGTTSIMVTTQAGTLSHSTTVTLTVN